MWDAGGGRAFTGSPRRKGVAPAGLRWLLKSPPRRAGQGALSPCGQPGSIPAAGGGVRKRGLEIGTANRAASKPKRLDGLPWVGPYFSIKNQDP